MYDEDFLLRVETELTDEALEARCMDAGIRVLSLGRYYHGVVPETDRHCLVINYSGLRGEQISVLEESLKHLKTEETGDII